MISPLDIFIMHLDHDHSWIELLEITKKKIFITVNYFANTLYEKEFRCLLVVNKESVFRLCQVLYFYIKIILFDFMVLGFSTQIEQFWVRMNMIGKISRWNPKSGLKKWFILDQGELIWKDRPLPLSRRLRPLWSDKNHKKII